MRPNCLVCLGIVDWFLLQIIERRIVYGQSQIRPIWSLVNFKGSLFFIIIFFQFYCWHSLVFLVRCAMCDVRLILWTYPFLKKIYIQYIRWDCIYKNLLVRLRLWRFGFWVYPSTTRKKRGKIIKNYYILREWRFKRLWPLNNVKWTNIFFCCFIYLFTQYDLKPPLLN